MNTTTQPADSFPAAGRPLTPASRTATFVLIALSGLPFVAYNWLPVLFNVFEKEFGLSLEQQGATQQLLFTAGLCIVLAGGFLMRRFGLRYAPAAASAAGCIGLFICASAPSFAILQAGCFVYGFSIAWIYTILGVLASRMFPQNRQRMFLISGMFISLVSGLGPAAIGWWVAHGHAWRNAFFLLGAVNSLLTIGLLFWSRVLPPAEVSGAAAGTKVRHPVATWTLWIISGCYVLHGIGEIGAVSWVGKLFHARIGLAEDRMALLVSAHVLSFAVGRLLLSFIAGRFPDRVLLAISSAGGAVFLFVVITTQSYVVAIAGMAASGLFLSGNSPAMAALLGHRFPVRLADAFAIYQGLGSVASGVAARVIGYAGDHAGLDRAVFIIPCAAAVLASVAIVWEHMDRRTRKINS